MGVPVLAVLHGDGWGGGVAEVPIVGRTRAVDVVGERTDHLPGVRLDESFRQGLNLGKAVQAAGEVVRRVQVPRQPGLEQFELTADSRTGCS